MRTAKTTHICLCLLASLISGKNVCMGQGRLSNETVSVISTLDETLLDFIGKELKSSFPHIEITHVTSDDHLLDTIRTLPAEKRPDIVFGTSTVVLSRLADQGFFEPYEPAWGDEMPVGLADRDRRWFGISGDPITIVYNRSYFENSKLEKYLPSGWESLANHTFNGSILMQTPTPFNETGYLFACLVDRAEQVYEDRNIGFDLLAEIDENVLQTYNNRAHLLSSLYSGGNGSISFAVMSEIQRSPLEGRPSGFILPEEGLFLFPRGIALMKGARAKAREAYDALTNKALLEHAMKKHGFFPLFKEGLYTFSSWPGEQLSLQFFPSDHDSIRRNISAWVSKWQNLIKGEKKNKTLMVDDAINAAMTLLVPLIIVIVILTSRGRRSSRSSKMK